MMSEEVAYVEEGLLDPRRRFLAQRDVGILEEGLGWVT